MLLINQLCCPPKLMKTPKNNDFCFGCMYFFLCDRLVQQIRVLGDFRGINARFIMCAYNLQKKRDY